MSEKKEKRELTGVHVKLHHLEGGLEKAIQYLNDLKNEYSNKGQLFLEEEDSYWDGNKETSHLVLLVKREETDDECALRLQKELKVKESVKAKDIALAKLLLKKHGVEMNEYGCYE